MAPISPPLRTALHEYRCALESALGAKVRRVTLFGSTARGEANEDSDVDLLVLLEKPSFLDRVRAMDLATETGLRHDCVFSPVVLSVAEWEELERRERRLPREIARDGVEA